GEVPDCQSGGWPHPRRVVVKVEVTPQGSQRRYVVTNLDEPARELYRDFYVRRGEVPEQPIGELKNGLHADRLSASGFCANALKMLVAVAAYALVVLYRQGGAGGGGGGGAGPAAPRGRVWEGARGGAREGGGGGGGAGGGGAGGSCLGAEPAGGQTARGGVGRCG